MDYKSDWDNSTQTDTIGQADSTIAQWPKVTIVYKDPVAINGNLKLKTFSSAKRIEVFNALGQRIFEFKSKNIDEVKLLLNKKKSGTYLARLYTDNGIVVKRINVIK